MAGNYSSYRGGEQSKPKQILYLTSGGQLHNRFRKCNSDYDREMQGGCCVAKRLEDPTQPREDPRKMNLWKLIIESLTFPAFSKEKGQ